MLPPNWNFHDNVECGIGASGEGVNPLRVRAM
jgi:hypothetical protein